MIVKDIFQRRGDVRRGGGKEYEFLKIRKVQDSEKEMGNRLDNKKR